MLMEIFKILKYSIPCSLKQLSNLGNQKFLLMTPKVKLEVNKQKKLYLKQLKFEIKSLVMLLKEMNLQILAFLFQDLSETQT